VRRLELIEAVVRTLESAEAVTVGVLQRGVERVGGENLRELAEEIRRVTGRVEEALTAAEERPVEAEELFGSGRGVEA